MSDGLWDFASGLMGAEEAFPGASSVGASFGGGGTWADWSPTWADWGAPTQPSAGWDFASKVGEGLGKVGGGLEKGWNWLTTGTGQQGQPTAESPLASFSRLLGLGATGLGISSALGTQRELAKETKMARAGQTTAQEVQKTGQQGQHAALAAAAPAVTAGTEQLAESRAGKLPPPMEAAVQQWVQRAKADMRGRYAKMGLGNSSDLQHEEARIDLMAEAMKAELLQGQEGLALQALQTGVSAGTGVSQAGVSAGAGAAQTASQQQNMLAALIQSANQQLGRLGGGMA